MISKRAAVCPEKISIFTNFLKTESDHRATNQRDVRPTFLRNVRLPPLSSAAIMQIMECLRYQRFHEVAQGPGQELEMRAGDYLMRLIEVVNFD
jgi:hypothetical protein